MKKIKNYIKGVFEVYCREFKLILHDQGLILFLTFLPLAYPVIYSLIYNPELVKDVPMVVIDSDRTSLTRELVRELDACDQVRVIGYAADLPEARKAMDNHDCFSILEIPTGFTKTVGRGETGAAVVGYNPHNNSNSVIGTMIGKALCYFTILALPIIFLVHYVPLIFSFPMAGNVLEELAFLTPMVLASMGVGFVFQAFVTERESVFVSWVVTSIFFLLVSGLIWPRYDMPSVWKFLSGLCPATWGVEGFVKMNSNGAGLWQVKEEYEMLWILAAGWWVAAWCIQRWVVLPAAGQRSSRKSKINDKALSQSVIDK